MFHTDNCGPMSVPTRLGEPYFNILVDDYSRYIIVTLMKTQSGYYDVLGEIYTHLQAHLANDHPVAALHSDCGTYFEKDLRVIDFCRRHGIRQTFSPPDTPALNAIAERNIRTLCEMTRAMMLAASAPGSMTCGGRP